MFTFYRTPQCPVCNHIQEALERLVIAHKVVTVHSVKEIKNKVDEEALKFNIKLLSKADRGGDEESTSRSMTRRQQRYAHEGDLV